jgi:hypothetical protein
MKEIERRGRQKNRYRKIEKGSVKTYKNKARNGEKVRERDSD